MSLFGVIAASQRGQCFANMARRFMVRESQAAIACHHLLRAMLPGLEAWTGSRSGLIEVLALMAGGALERPLISPSLFSSHGEREEGRMILARLKAASDLDPHEIRQAGLRSGLEDRVLGQMLPFVALLLLAAFKIRSERELGAILARRAPAAMRRSGDTFADLGRMLAAEESDAGRPGRLKGLLSGMLGRRGAGPGLGRLQPA